MDVNAKIRAIRRLIKDEMWRYAEAAELDRLMNSEFGIPGFQELRARAERMSRTMRRLGVTASEVVQALATVAQREAEHQLTDMPRAFYEMEFFEFELKGDGAW